MIWGGEFGRTPFNENGKGRDHNPWGFTTGWLAADARRLCHWARPTRSVCGSLTAAAHVHDLHATILHALGLNHINLTYLHNGRAERPTIVAGEVARDAFKNPPALC